MPSMSDGISFHYLSQQEEHREYKEWQVRNEYGKELVRAVG